MRLPRGSVTPESSSHKTMSGRVSPEGTHCSGGKQEVNVAPWLKYIKKIQSTHFNKPHRQLPFPVQQRLGSSVSADRTHARTLLASSSIHPQLNHQAGRRACGITRSNPARDLCRTLSPGWQSTDTTPAALSQDVVRTADCIWEKK